MQPSRPVSPVDSGRNSTAVRFAHLGEGARIERLSRLKRVWRVVRAHLFGEVPIEALDLPGEAERGSASSPALPAEAARARDADAPPTRDAIVDEASDDSFPASDPPSFTATRV